jgi:hypothetical protein
MVVGTQHPWAERGLLHYGAKHITTIEYMKIESQHPKLSTMYPVEAARRFLARNLTLVDFIWTYSSLEHDGLGRYGDPINPYTDLESIKHYVRKYVNQYIDQLVDHDNYMRSYISKRKLYINIMKVTQ